MIGVASKRRSGPRARLAFPFEQCAIGHRALIGSQAAHELVGSRKPTTGRACFKKRSPSQRPHACCLRSAFWRRRHMPQTAASPSAAADRVNAIGSLPTTLEAGFFGSRRGLAGTRWTREGAAHRAAAAEQALRVSNGGFGSSAARASGASAATASGQRQGRPPARNQPTARAGLCSLAARGRLLTPEWSQGGRRGRAAMRWSSLCSGPSTDRLRVKTRTKTKTNLNAGAGRFFRVRERHQRRRLQTAISMAALARAKAKAASTATTVASAKNWRRWHPVMRQPCEP